ncbi:Molybdopterin molybdenumtransferase [Polystyrenella longa]|uniref:Molybdopterin molybdenumtransferase n=1 Tax=Polystyrenella longa TaxID=2528007 RepID=A0A518CRQ1_9PLAN|nr:gephyrin-like molybdotransferase Glp [Polystyrenella longa]QDU81909.1 Molybdopterin molybdenumtransferase [Polystyrenella longa]
MLSIDEALDIVSSRLAPLTPVERHLHDTQGLLLAQTISSPLNSPPFDKACMDGYAVRSADFEQDKPVLKLIGELTAGQVSSQKVNPGEAIRIMTGAPIPAGADAVVQHELTEFNKHSNEIVFKIDEIRAGLNVLNRGEIMREGEAVFTEKTRLRPQELAVLAEMGFVKVQIFPPPRVAVLATGDELVAVEETPGPGQIRNTNEVMLVEQLRQAGAIPVPLGIARDNRDDLQAKIELGLQHDMLILSGGVSAGKLDLVPSVLESLDVQEIFHKVQMKPGKPIWFGQQNQASDRPPKTVFGLPGNPVSSMVCFEIFVKTALRRTMGDDALSSLPIMVCARLTHDHLHKGDRPTYWPVQFELAEGEVRITPLDWRGSSDLKGTVLADGMALFSKPDFVYKAGTIFNFYPWK